MSNSVAYFSQAPLTNIGVHVDMILPSGISAEELTALPAFNPLFRINLRHASTGRWCF